MHLGGWWLKAGLLNSPVCLSGSYTIQGRQVRVYQPEFEESWAQGLVSHHDPLSHIMEIIMDQVCACPHRSSNHICSNPYGTHTIIVCMNIKLFILNCRS